MRCGVVAPESFEHPREYVPDICLEWLEEGLKTNGGEQALEDVLRQIRAREVVVVAVLDDAGNVVAAFTSRLCEYDRVRALRVLVGAGRQMDEWLDTFLEFMDAGARQYNCQRVEVIAGRRGWERALEGRAFKSHAVMVREVGYEPGFQQDDYVEPDEQHEQLGHRLVARDGRHPEPRAAGAA